MPPPEAEQLKVSPGWPGASASLALISSTSVGCAVAHPWMTLTEGGSVIVTGCPMQGEIRERVA